MASRKRLMVKIVSVVRQCSMSSMQHVARCFEMQRVRYSVTLFSRLQRVALKNTQRVA